MKAIETPPTLEEILDGIRELSDQEQRKLAAAAAADRKLEPFLEELEDILVCERATEEGPAEPLVATEFTTP